MQKKRQQILALIPDWLFQIVFEGDITPEKSVARLNAEMKDTILDLEFRPFWLKDSFEVAIMLGDNPIASVCQSRTGFHWQPQIEIEKDDIDFMLEQAQEKVAKTLNVFEYSDDKIQMAKSLIQFGTLVIKPLSTLFEEAEDIEVKILAACILVRLGDNAKLNYLESILYQKGYCATFTANQLTQICNSNEVIPILTNCFHMCESSLDSKLINICMDNLESLGISRKMIDSFSPKLIGETTSELDKEYTQQEVA